MLVFNGFLLFLLCVSQVNSMALKGPPVTTYDPCGLGVIYFNKLANSVWQGFIHLGIYTHLKNEVIIGLKFENNVTIYWPNKNSSNTWNDLELRLNGNIPDKYTFFIALGVNNTGVPTLEKFTLNGLTLCDDSIKASQTIESLNVTKDDQHYAHVCGRRAIDHAELTTVSTESKAGDWPWHVAILHKDPISNGTVYYCGGNIISRTAIVTAGHCVRKYGITLEANRIVVLAGINNHKDAHQVGRQIFTAERVILHPNYDDAESTADLAVININKLEYTKYVQPVCIWGPVYDKADLFGHQAMVVGFGAKENKEDNRPSDILRSTYTIVQNDTTCLTYDFPLYVKLLNEFTFCAGFGPEAGINPRNGDSGGGLVIPMNQPDHKISWFLRGVLSKCGVSPGQIFCDPKYYTIYTDVGPHYGWIYHHSGLQFGSNILKKMA